MRQVESGFCEQVEVLRVPRGSGGLAWFPQAEVAREGLARDRRSCGHEWVMTTDVDLHADDAWGYTLLWVLVNPGFVFQQQGYAPFVPAQGAWFIFDDRHMHKAEPGPATPEDGVFLAWAVRLRERARKVDRVPGTRSSGAKVLEERAAGEDHQVVTVQGAFKGYRRKPCGGCPWRVENNGSFPAEAFRHSARTAYDLSEHVFACHESGVAKTQTCAGFLLHGADNNLAVRLGYSRGRYADDVCAGGAKLHASYREMAVANGVAPDEPVLAPCRP